MTKPLAQRGNSNASGGAQFEGFEGLYGTSPRESAQHSVFNSGDAQ
ncbi:hypothetical protein [Nocardia ignorata]|uniref:Uncharacterized protein n=1 Tax=Nocardia ignorata TaxID=145285 RepID=A0A4R6NYK2_NOCIG|nr:hypothetical protein [Nocardia ignorata]TDP29856.1 hypothetical protein DFR75_112125 [Nocardia ignorata]